MKNLFLIRHAKSDWGHIGLTDFERPLNERGERNAPFMAQQWQSMYGALSAPLLVSSPAKRALTTATHFAKVLGIATAAIRQEPRIYEALEQDLLRIIAGLPTEATTVLVFGHNPTLTDVANHFSEDYIANVPTCGVVYVRSTAETWHTLDPINSEVIDFIYPKMYA